MKIYLVFKYCYKTNSTILYCIVGFNTAAKAEGWIREDLKRDNITFKEEEGMTAKIFKTDEYEYYIEAINGVI